MPSLRSHLLVAVLKLIRRKRIYASVEGLMRGIADVRAEGPHRPSAALQTRLSIQLDSHQGHDVYTVSPRDAAPSSAAPVLYWHGGAYVRPINRYHWDLIADLVAQTGRTFVVPFYPLAPEHPAPHVIAWAMSLCAAWQAHRPTQPLAFMGDSAGGGLALALTLALRDQGLPLPASLALICPWVDVRVPHPQAEQTARIDPMLALAGAREAGRLYAGEWGMAHPYVSPLQADLRGLPPVTLLVGARDILSHDALTLAGRLRDAQVPLHLSVAPGMVHIWPVLPIPEAHQARSLLVQSLRDDTNASSSPSSWA